jgi:hypothetical protein
MVLQVRIMKDWDPSGRRGPKEPLPDVVKVLDPKVRARRHSSEAVEGTVLLPSSSLHSCE